MIEDAIATVTNAFITTNFAGQTWIMSIIIITATMLIITRHYKDWMTLTLPVMIGWIYFGMTIPYVFVGIAVVMFVTDVLSTEVISAAISAGGKILTPSGRAEKAYQRMDIRKEMKKRRRETKEFRNPLLEQERKALERQKSIYDELGWEKFRNTLRKNIGMTEEEYRRLLLKKKYSKEKEE